jgi:hypothetical protein
MAEKYMIKTKIKVNSINLTRDDLKLIAEQKTMTIPLEGEIIITYGD